MWREVVELPQSKVVWVVVLVQGGDVLHVGVVHQGVEGDLATVEEVEYLGSSL